MVVLVLLWWWGYGCLLPEQQCGWYQALLLLDLLLAAAAAAAAWRVEQHRFGLCPTMCALLPPLLQVLCVVQRAKRKVFPACSRHQARQHPARLSEGVSE